MYFNTYFLDLQRVPGKLHLVADGWTSPNVISFIGATVQFVNDGKINSVVLDFIKYVTFFFDLIQIF